MAARARRMACIVASVPLLPKRTISTGKRCADFFGQFPFHVVRHAEHGAGAETVLHGFHDRGMAMSGHERAETKVVIDVFVAIEIAEIAEPLPSFTKMG